MPHSLSQSWNAFDTGGPPKRDDDPFDYVTPTLLILCTILLGIWAFYN